MAGYMATIKSMVAKIMTFSSGINVKKGWSRPVTTKRSTKANASITSPCFGSMAK